MLNARKSTRVTPHVPSPTAVATNRVPLGSTVPASDSGLATSIQFPRSFHKTVIDHVGSEGHYYLTADGRRILDASGGASVSIFGPGPNRRVWEAVSRTYAQYGGYHCGYSFTNDPVRAFIDALVRSTDGHMETAILYNSGSEAVEAAGKLLLQYHAERNQPQRRLFVTREQSYHGTTFGALSLGSYWARRQPFEDVLMDVHRVPACNPYRTKKSEETDQQYVARLRARLEETFLNVGPDTIAGFICEPVVGAALGCMPAVPGYLQAVREVCDKYDIPLVFDEIMCGYGRCGTLHAWQDYGVAPDIQLMGKGLAGGWEQLSAMLIGKKRGFSDVIRDGTGYFNHGHTFQGTAKTCAAALETLAMVKESLPNVRAMGERLMRGLQARVGAHPCVGDIRGKGLFIGIEFVQNKLSKAAFSPDDKVSVRIHELGLTSPHNIHVYLGTGSANPDGREGDHIMIAPPYDVDEAEVDLIVGLVGDLIDRFFKEFKSTAK